MANKDVTPSNASAKAENIKKQLVLTGADIVSLGEEAELLVGGKNYNTALISQIEEIQAPHFRAISSVAFHRLLDETRVSSKIVRAVVDRDEPALAADRLEALQHRFLPGFAALDHRRELFKRVFLAELFVETELVGARRDDYLIDDRTAFKRKQCPDDDRNTVERQQLLCAVGVHACSRACRRDDRRGEAVSVRGL